MSDGNICSNDSMHGGFGAMMANSLLHCGEEERARHWEEECTTHTRAVAAASAAPTCADKTVAAVRAPGTKKSPLLLLPSAPTSPSTPTSARRQGCGMHTCGEEVPPCPSCHARCGAHAPRPSCRACCGARAVFAQLGTT